MSEAMQHISETAQSSNTAGDSGDANQDAVAAYQSTGYRYFVLGALTLVYIFNFVDRQVVNILGQSIIDDLGLTDAQFGALSGIAFAAVYVTVGNTHRALGRRRGAA